MIYNFFKYPVISRKKSLILLIVILFASSIFSSYTSIVYSINNFQENIYGNESNILIVKDTSSNTPFTSTVPKSYVDVLSQINGVTAVSPEYYIPGIIGEMTMFLRSFDITSFRQISSYNIISGTDLSSTDFSSVVIGKTLAKNGNLHVGDIIQFESTLNNQKVMLKIKGIFSSIHKNLENEIFSILHIGEKLIREDIYYNHIRVKFDASITSKEEITSIITNTYNVNFQVFWEKSIIKTDWELKIYDTKSNLIYIDTESGIASKDIPFGQYSLEAVVNGTISDRIDFFVDSNKTITIDFSTMFHTVNISTSYANHPMSLDFSVYSKNKLLLKNSTNTQGFSQIKLLEDNYVFKVTNGIVEREYSKFINSDCNLSLPIESLLGSNIILGLRNNSIITQNKGDFEVGRDLSIAKISALLDGHKVAIKDNSFSYNLPDGPHNITFYDNYLNQETYRIYFEVKSNATFSDGINFSNYSRFRPGDLLKIDSRLINYNSPINIDFNFDNISSDFVLANTNIELTLPNVYGLLSINLRAKTFNLTNIDKTFNIILTDNSTYDAGILFPGNYTPTFKGNDKIPIWFSNPLTSITIDSQTTVYDNMSVIVPNLSTGIHQLKIITLKQENTYNFNFTDTYASGVLLQDENNGTSFELTGSVKWLSDNVRVDFPESLYNVFATYGSLEVEIFKSQIIPTIVNNNLITSFSVENKISGTIENVDVNFSPQNTTTKYPIPINFIPKVMTNGLIQTGTADNTSQWQFIQLSNFTSLVNYQLEYQVGETLLSPGIWNITLSLSGNVLNRKVIVPKWVNQIDFTNQFVNFDKGEIYIENGSLSISQDIVFSISSTQIYFHGASTNTILPKISSSDTLAIQLSPSLLNPKISITFNNGSTFLTHDSWNIQIDKLTGLQQYNIEYNDFYGKINTISDTIKMNVTTVIHSLNIVDRFYDNNSEYHIIITNLYSNSELSYSTNLLNSTFAMIPGLLLVQVSQNGKTQEIISSRQSLSVLMNNPIITLTLFDQNFGKYFSYFGELNYTNLATNQTVSVFYQNSTPLKMKVGNYTLSIRTDNGITKVKREIFENANLIIKLNPINTSAIIEIFNAKLSDFNNFYLIHDVTNTTTRLTFINDNNWLLSNFPIGKVTLKLYRASGIISFDAQLLPTSGTLEFILDLNKQDLNINKIRVLSDSIDVETSGDITANQSGPLGFLKLLIFAETFAIAFLLLINIIGVFIGLCYDIKEEIFSLKSIGFSENRILLHILSNTLQVSVPMSIIGSYLGLQIANSLFDLGNTTLFGFNFTPVFPLPFYILNIIIIHILCILGSKLGLKILPKIV